MPEGHSVHRITRQFARNFVGTRLEVTSPQGRFAGSAELSGREMTDARAVGKQMFLEFDDELWLRVHLGIYGAWDFAGEIVLDPRSQVQRPPDGADRHGRTRGRGGEDSLTSIGAPRRSPAPDGRERDEHARWSGSAARARRPGARPPDERVSVADLRGPTACEILTPEEVEMVLDRLGPDPANENPRQNVTAS